MRAGAFSICSITRNIGFVKERSDALPFLFLFSEPLPPALRILRQQLLRHKELAAVEAVGAGEHIADTAAQRDQLQPHAAEQLIGQQDGGDEGVRRAAEHRDEAHGGGEPGGQAQQRAECTAEGRTDVEAGDDLAALEARREGQGGYC